MMIRTTREVVKALGGIDGVVRLTGASADSVSAWQARLNRFPAKTYLVMTEALAEMGMSASPALWNMVASQVDTARGVSA